MINQSIHRSKLLLFFAFLMFVIFNVFCFYIIKNHIIISALTDDEDDETVIQLTNLMNDPSTNPDKKDKCESLISEIKNIKPKIIKQIKTFYDSIITSSLNDPKYTEVSSIINNNLSLKELIFSDEASLLTEMSQCIQSIIDNNQNIEGLLNKLLNATQIQDMISTYYRLKNFLDNNQNSLNKIEDSNNKLSSNLKISSETLEILKTDIQYISNKLVPEDYKNVDTFILNVVEVIQNGVTQVFSNSESTKSTETSKKQIIWWFIIITILLVLFIIIFFHHKKKKHHHKPYYFEKEKF